VLLFERADEWKQEPGSSEPKPAPSSTPRRTSGPWPAACPAGGRSSAGPAPPARASRGAARPGKQGFEADEFNVVSADLNADSRQRGMVLAERQLPASKGTCGVGQGSTSNRSRCSTTKSTGTANVKPAPTMQYLNCCACCACNTSSLPPAAAANNSRAPATMARECARNTMRDPDDDNAPTERCHQCVLRTLRCSSMRPHTAPASGLAQGSGRRVRL